MKNSNDTNEFRQLQVLTFPSDEKKTKTFYQHLAFLLDIDYDEELECFDKYGIIFKEKKGWYGTYKIESVLVLLKGASENEYKNQRVFRLGADKPYSLSKIERKLDAMREYVKTKRAEVVKEQREEKEAERIEKVIKDAFPKGLYFKFDSVSIDIEDGVKEIRIDIENQESKRKLKWMGHILPELKVVITGEKKEFVFDYSVDFRHDPNRNEFKDAVVEMNELVKFTESEMEKVISALKKVI